MVFGSCGSSCPVRGGESSPAWRRGWWHVGVWLPRSLGESDGVVVDNFGLVVETRLGVVPIVRHIAIARHWSRHGAGGLRVRCVLVLVVVVKGGCRLGTGSSGVRRRVVGDVAVPTCRRLALTLAPALNSLERIAVTRSLDAECPNTTCSALATTLPGSSCSLAPGGRRGSLERGTAPRTMARGDARARVPKPRLAARHGHRDAHERERCRRGPQAH